MEIQPFESGRISMNGGPTIAISKIAFKSQSLHIDIREREGISLYALSSSMLPNPATWAGTDHYTFSGPKLGIYHDTADPREGPFVNHYIEQLNVVIDYPCHYEARFAIKGKGDLSKSSIDPYWYKGETSGSWGFEISFTFRPRAVTLA